MKDEIIMKKKLTYLLAFSVLLLLGCGKELKQKEQKKDVEWKGPVTENLPDGVIAIEPNGDTLTLEDFEKTIDSLEYYMGKYFEEQDEE